MKSQFKKELWKPIGLKPVEVKEVIQPGKQNSFLDYQAPEDRYEVRGIMPKAPEHPKMGNPEIGRKHSFLGYVDEICKKTNK